MNNGITIKLDSECLKHINLFQAITKASVKDCIIDYDKVLFVVNQGQAGMAIGKNGVNIKNIQRLIKKKIEIIEYNNQLVDFLNNILRPVKVNGVEDSIRNSKKSILIGIDDENQINPKALVKAKIKKAKPLLKKYFDVDDVNIQ